MSIPNKHFYTIGDVSSLTKIKPHILRYWESHFKVLRPARRYSGHRKYTSREIDLINRIRFLVLDKKFTLSGAKKEIHRQLNQKNKWAQPTSPSVKPTADQEGLIRDIKKDVEDCLKIIDSQPQLELTGLK